MRRSRAGNPPPAPPVCDQPHVASRADGGQQALDQVANWVRFADTKATIMTAALGVALTMLMTNARTIAIGIKLDHPGAYIVSALAFITLLAFCYTLYWLLRSIAPELGVRYRGINRYAWPALVDRTADKVIEHADTTDVRMELWQQVIDLADMANRKFDACSRAIRGFAVFVTASLVCVVVAIGMGA